MTPDTPRRVEFSMSPLYTFELLSALQLAAEHDPDVHKTIKRVMVGVRASGYSEETLVEAVKKEIKQRLGEGTIIYCDDEEA